MHRKFATDDYAYCVYRSCLAVDRILDGNSTHAARMRATKWARAWGLKAEKERKIAKAKLRLGSGINKNNPILGSDLPE
jgi:hypothetical protein